MIWKSTVTSINQHRTEIPNYFRSKRVNILLHIVHHNFSKLVGLRNRSNHYITIGDTLFSSRSDKDHLQNLSSVQEEKQEHFLSTVDNIEKPNYLALVILYLFKKSLLSLSSVVYVNYLSMCLSNLLYN